MTCEQFRQILPEMPEGVCDAEQDAHLKSCSECSSLVSDLGFIIRESRLLQMDEEPSPRVWNSIEIALRQEGLIRPAGSPAHVSTGFWHWRPAWALISATAVVVLALGVAFNQHKRAGHEIATIQTPAVLSAVAPPAKARRAVAPEDRQMLDAISSRSPVMAAAYEASLQDVNDYIRDAEESVQRDPNDEDAQQYLMDAYQQRAVVYQMALDRPLP